MVVYVDDGDEELGGHGVWTIRNANGKVVLLFGFPIKVFGKQYVPIVTTDVEVVLVVTICEKYLCNINS